MNLRRLLIAAFAFAPLAAGQMLNPQKLLEPPTDTWPTYNGDYSGRRYSTLAQINSSNIHSLAVAWMFRISDVGPQRGVGAPVIKYINRLSDHLFVAGRFANDKGKRDVLWTPGANR